MRFAILSDIHGNLEALKTVVEDVKIQSPDEVICLGDMIGYGPDPDRVLDLVRAQGFTSVLGNHEGAIVDHKLRNWLNFQSRENNIATHKLLSEVNLNYIAHLPSSLVRGNVRFVHGYPPDSLVTYLHNVSKERLFRLLSQGTEEIYFVGHTHKLSRVCLEGDKVVTHQLFFGKTVIEKEKKHLVNCGSVGQPRDGNNEAKYILFDTEQWSVEVRCIPYDFEVTIKKIEQMGFPQVYGTRLR